MHAVWPQAFMFARMRVWRLAGVLSMKLTVSCRGDGPQYFAVRTAMRIGSRTKSAATCLDRPQVIGIGICGAGAAVANAVYNATGIRIRDYPITLDKVLRAWVQAERDQRSSAVPPLLPG